MYFRFWKNKPFRFVDWFLWSCWIKCLTNRLQTKALNAHSNWQWMNPMFGLPKKVYWISEKNNVYWIRDKTRNCLFFSKMLQNLQIGNKIGLFQHKHLWLISNWASRTYIFGTMKIIRCLSIEKHFSWPNLIWFWSHFGITTLSTKVHNLKMPWASHDCAYLLYRWTTRCGSKTFFLYFHYFIVQCVQLLIPHQTKQRERQHFNITTWWFSRLYDGVHDDRNNWALQLKSLHSFLLNNLFSDLMYYNLG